MGTLIIIIALLIRKKRTGESFKAMFSKIISEQLGWFTNRLTMKKTAAFALFLAACPAFGHGKKLKHIVPKELISTTAAYRSPNVSQFSDPAKSSYTVSNYGDLSQYKAR
jgi:hypothetical protein